MIIDKCERLKMSESITITCCSTKQTTRALTPPQNKANPFLGATLTTSGIRHIFQ